MRCVTHYDREVVATCPECGAGLCPECYHYTHGHYCYNCVADTYRSHKNFTKGYTKSIITWTIILGILGIVGAIVISKDTSLIGTELEYLPILCGAFGFLGGFAYGGAKFANKNSGLTLASKCWMFVTCILLAPFFFVIRLVDYIKTYKTLKELEESYKDYPR